MKNILLIGVGGTGGETVRMLYRKIDQLGNRTDNRIMALLFNMDTGKINPIEGVPSICMTDDVDVGRVCDRIGAERLNDWFRSEEEEIRSQSMTFGVSLWRKKAYLAFLNMMYKKESRIAFHRAMEQMANSEPGSSFEIYLISSIAGATGSGTFLPIALYARRYIRQHLGITPAVSAMITCPDIYADYLVPENVDKAYANSYAAMRELNAINQVARSGCNRKNNLKKTSVRFKLGSEDEPVVGVLFDSTDKRYWRPDAAPFDKIYVLDRIPGVHTIEEHYVVLADSLYTLICTNVGRAVDAEMSNHMTLTSQNNGGNAIFSSISTARIKFPSDTILEYLAAERTQRVCKDQWLTLHNETARRIEEKRQRAVEKQEVFSLSEADYAAILLEALEEYEETDSGVMEIVNRWTRLPAGYSGAAANSAEAYFMELRRMIGERASNPGSITAMLEDATPEAFTVEDEGDQLYGQFLSKKKNKHPERMVRFCTYVQETIQGFYGECLETVRKSEAGICDAVLTFDETKNPRGHKELSLAERILIRDDKFMHPVAAMVQLCRLRQYLQKQLKGSRPGLELTPFGREKKVPDAFYVEGEPPAVPVRMRKSRYWHIGEDLTPETRNLRIPHFEQSFERYCKKASADEYLDFEALRTDAIATVEHIAEVATENLRYRVYKRIAARLDLLIKHYRRFFDRFVEVETDARADLDYLKKRDGGRIGSIINVCAGEADKSRILESVFGESGADRREDVERADNIAGSGVFGIAMQSVREEQEESGGNKDDRNVVRRLLDNMNQDHKNVIRQNAEFRRISSMSVIEALEEACGKHFLEPDAFRSNLDRRVDETFISAVELASPTLQIEATRADEEGTIQPSEIWRVLMSVETARHIKKNSAWYHLPVQDDVTEEVAIRSLAEEFVKKHVHPRANVSVVKDMPDNVMYVTGELMDITPVRIAKINEMSRIPGYYTHYCRVLDIRRETGLDIWNPHLGFDCDKRAVLPYINEEMDRGFDSRVVKALLYAFLEGKITIAHFDESRREKFRFILHDRGEPQVCRWDEDEIGENNASLLLALMREDEIRVDAWSRELDRRIQRELKTLPNAYSSDHVKRLNRAIAEIPLMKILREGICPLDGAKNAGKRVMTIFDFADMIKRSEEARRDQNDAEKLLCTTFELFEQICLTAARPDINLEIAVDVYTDQLERLYGQFEQMLLQKYELLPKKSARDASAEESGEEGSDGESPQTGGKSKGTEASVSAAVLAKRRLSFRNHLSRVLEWAVNEVGAFRPVDLTAPLDEEDSFRYMILKDPYNWMAALDDDKKPRK